MRFGILLSALLAFTSCSVPRRYLEAKLDQPGAQYPVSSSDTELETKDGVLLHSLLYRPRAEGRRFPAIVVRLPLPDDTVSKMMAGAIGELWASRGYVVLVQGVRGKFRSKGRFESLVNERSDGEDTLRWLQKQPFANGEIYLWGGSYFGLTEWAVADLVPENHGALIVQIASANVYGMMYPGGAFGLASALYWSARDRGAVPSLEAIRRAASGRSPAEADRRLGGAPGALDEWAEHPIFDQFWQRRDFRAQRDEIKVPVLFMAGWYDPFLVSQLDDYQALRSSKNQTVASRTGLIIGPWSHAETVSAPNHDATEKYRLASIRPALPWFDLLRDRSSRDGRILVYFMGADRWQEERSWPPDDVSIQHLYLQERGGLDSQLSRGGDSYTFDPADPSPTTGGSFLGPEAGIREQTSIEARPDVLLYSSPSLREDMEVIGDLRAVLYAKSSARSTDLIVRLTDVGPDGKSFNVTDGIVRHIFRNTGNAERIEVRLAPTAMLFRKGHKLRVQITSSDFPRYDLNGCTNGTARVEILHSAEQPSAVLLPVRQRHQPHVY
ncbi:MAG: CocE/NonD family hydrolase [Bdellovibrionota bacterium]